MKIGKITGESTFALLEPNITTNNVVKITAHSSIEFYNQESVVGVLEFGSDKMTFTGNADESAKLFCDSVLKYALHMIENNKLING